MSTSLFRFRKSWLLWAPFLTLFLMYMLMPERCGLVHDFHARVVILVMVVGLLVIAPRQQAQNAIGFSWTVVPVILAMIFLSVRFSNFNRESRGINEMFKKMNASPYCLSLTVDKASDYVPGLVYFHFPIYGQLHKGGFFEFSFSTVFNQYIVSRKKDGSSHPLAELYCWRPELFNWQYSSAYDYYLVRARRDPVRLFKGAQGIKLMANQGNWWLYKNKTKSESLDLDGSERLIYR